MQTWADELVKELHSYTEVSPSGTGVKLLLKGKSPGKRTKSGSIEIYSQGRYFTLTGSHLPTTPLTIESRQEQLSQLYNAVFGQALTDEQVISLATSPDGGKLATLWAGNTEVYPSPSEADLALCSLLTYWTRGDARRIELLFN